MNIEKTLPKAWESIETKLAKGTYNGSASDLKSLIDGKESSISKKSGFNLDKSDAINSNVSTTLATSAAVKTAYDKGVEALTNSNTKLTKGNLPAKITNAEDMYKLLENKSGLEFDPNLLYLNDAGTKTTGKAYFDRNKKGIFKCIQTTSSTTNSTTYFVDFSNNANSDRLTNLSIKSVYKTTDYISTIEKELPLPNLTNNCIVLVSVSVDRSGEFKPHDLTNVFTYNYSYSPSKIKFVLTSDKVPEAYKKITIIAVYY